MAFLSFTLALSHSFLHRHVYKSSTPTTTTQLSRPPHWLSPDPLVLPPIRIRLRRRLVSFPPCIPRSSLTSATAPLLQDAGATAAVLAGAYSLVLTFDSLTQRNLIQQSLSRKLVHVLSGLLFAACWPIFSNSTRARYFASVVPFVNCLRLVINGFFAADEGLIKSVTREGNPKELLRGPLYYVLILILCALVFWRESPTGVISLAMMCGGDGVADIIGRRFGSMKLPYNQNKSWAGSISMFICGFLISIGMLYYYSALGYFRLDWIWTIRRVAVVALVATVVESLPTAEVVDDNISVPLSLLQYRLWENMNSESSLGTRVRCFRYSVLDFLLATFEEGDARIYVSDFLTFDKNNINFWKARNYEEDKGVVDLRELKERFLVQGKR
ncbi:unnamed protein product [Dovyalis caffra]|uniref:phytol kinase n=1 Tax=Dovyalis caffra TaxID=77055 RepID=A0AAV1QUF0_9ROSI|nr:unnamed protein product [Dovyalis caffra]